MNDKCFLIIVPQKAPLSRHLQISEERISLYSASMLQRHIAGLYSISDDDGRCEQADPNHQVDYVHTDSTFVLDPTGINAIPASILFVHLEKIRNQDAGLRDDNYPIKFLLKNIEGKMIGYLDIGSGRVPQAGTSLADEKYETVLAFRLVR